DTAAPAAPVVTGIASDTGASSSDGITSDTSLSVTGTAEANSTVTVFDGATQLETTTASGAGAWTFVDSRTLTNGSSHSYKATAAGTARNPPAIPTRRSSALDTAAPAAPVVTGILSDTGSSSSDGITNDTSLSVTGTAEANSTVTVFDGATSLGTTTASGAGGWT